MDIENIWKWGQVKYDGREENKEIEGNDKEHKDIDT